MTKHAKGQIGAVVTGGDHQGLAAVRTLARKGIPVVITDHDHCIGRYSRYCSRFFKAPHPSDTVAYTDFLIRLAQEEGLQGWVLIADSDELVHAISTNKERLSQYYRVSVPDWEPAEKVYVKAHTYRIAAAQNIPIPKTWFPGSLDELLQMDIVYPAVLKPSVRDHFYSKVKIKAFLVRNREELISTYHRMCEVIDPSEILVQDLIPGGPNQLFSVGVFFKDGRIRASMMGRRTRQHPMDFGHATTYAEVVNYPEMQATAERFLQAINFYGVGEVEFMLDPRDGVFKLIEVNPRIWGWHLLAIAAGVDLPYLLYCDQTGKPVEPGTARTPMKWVRMITDLPTVALEVSKGRMRIRDWLGSLRGPKQFSVWAADDPLPCLMESLMVPYLWIKRGF
jgi:predicted ATP-grasp superfamily ATP-dependent carboligase